MLFKQKNQYEKGLTLIKETGDQLETTKNKIKKLQPAIILIESETAKTVKNLNIQKKNAEETNKNLMAKNE